MVSCALHTHLKFANWKEYDNHVHMFHRAKGEKIKPHKDSGRSSGVTLPGGVDAKRGTVVGDAEATWLKPYLVTDENMKRAKSIKEAEEKADARQGHPGGCKCFDCVMGS